MRPVTIALTVTNPPSVHALAAKHWGKLTGVEGDTMMFVFSDPLAAVLFLAEYEEPIKRIASKQWNAVRP